MEVVRVTISLTKSSVAVTVKFTAEIPNYSSERNQSIRNALLNKGYMVIFEDGVFQAATRTITVIYEGESLDVETLKFNAENVLNLIINSFADLDNALSKAPPTDSTSNTSTSDVSKTGTTETNTTGAGSTGTGTNTETTTPTS